MMEENRTSSEVNVEESYSAREERRLKIENTFNTEHFQVVRKELFAHLRDPQVMIRNGNITFNTACINGLEDAVYVKLMISEGEKRIAVRKCNEDDTNALRWCIAKPG